MGQRLPHGTAAAAVLSEACACLLQGCSCGGGGSSSGGMLVVAACTTPTHLPAALHPTTLPNRQVTEMKLKVETAERERDFYFEKLRDIEVLCQAPELQVRARAWACLGLARALQPLRAHPTPCRVLSPHCSRSLARPPTHAPTPPLPQEIPAVRIVEKILYAADSGAQCSQRQQPAAAAAAVSRAGRCGGQQAAMMRMPLRRFAAHSRLEQP